VNAALLYVLTLPGAPLPPPKPPDPVPPARSAPERPPWKDPLWPTLCRFPGPQACEGCVALAEAHLAWLNGARAPEGYPWRGDELTYRREDAAWRVEPWRHLSVAWDRESWHLEVRRSHLRSLRETLGEAAFREGRMPHPVAWERFGIMADR
jgi:hypothetical protein